MVIKTSNPYELIEWNDLCKLPSLTKPSELIKGLVSSAVAEVGFKCRL